MAAAQIACRAHLLDRPTMPCETRNELVLGSYLVETGWKFELYVPGMTPEDAVVLVEILVGADINELQVVSFPERWMSAAEK